MSVRGSGNPWLSIRGPRALWSLVRGPGVPSLSVTATKYRKAICCHNFCHWWYFNWGRPGPPGFPPWLRLCPTDTPFPSLSTLTILLDKHQMKSFESINILIKVKLFCWKKFFSKKFLFEKRLSFERKKNFLGRKTFFCRKKCFWKKNFFWEKNLKF